MNSNCAPDLHLAGEAVFTCPTCGGQVRRCPTHDALTPFEGLVFWAAFQKPCGLIKALAATCPVARTSHNAAPVYDVLTSFRLTVRCGGIRFTHVPRLREDSTPDERLGLESVVGDNTLRRFVASVPEATGTAGGWRNGFGSAPRRADPGLGRDGANPGWPEGKGSRGLQPTEARVQEFSSAAGGGGAVGAVVLQPGHLFLRLLETGPYVESPGGRG